MNWKNRLRTLALLMFTTAIVHAQELENNRVSPLAVISIQYKITYVKIVYSQPAKRGRQIFGKVVPYGQVWRTGANEATEITITRDIILNDNLLKAGTYSIFTIPEKDSWTIIVNKDVGLWGAYNYNPARDEMRFKVNVSRTEQKVYERFTMQFDHRNEVATLQLFWDAVKVSIPIKFIN